MTTFELQSEPALTEKQHSTSAYTALSPDDQDAVRVADGVIFDRWPTPKLSIEGRTAYAEDIAILCSEFHALMVRDSVAWHRQNFTRRPTVGHLRERCALAREQAKGKQKDAQVIADNEYRARIQSHPQEFVPLALIIRDTVEWQIVKAKHFPNGNVDLVWRMQWWDWRNGETEKEWASLRALGVVALGFKEEPKDRYGRPIRPAGELARVERVA